MLTGGPQGRWTHRLPPFKGGSVAPTFMKIQDRLLASDTRCECCLYVLGAWLEGGWHLFSQWQCCSFTKHDRDFMENHLSQAITGLQYCSSREVAWWLWMFGIWSMWGKEYSFVYCQSPWSATGKWTFDNHKPTSTALEGLVYSKVHCQPYSKSPGGLMCSV